MIRQYHQHLLLIVVVLFAINAVGCGLVGLKKEPPEPKYIPIPIDVRIRIKDWTIKQHRIIGETYRLGETCFAGRFLFHDDLIFKLKAEKVPDWYWLVKIPSVEEGVYTIRAKPYEEYSITLSPVEAPERFNMSIKIEDGSIRSHFIIDPDPRWDTFHIFRFKPPIVYLKNDRYPERVWAARVPKKDGIWTIYFTLIK